MIELYPIFNKFAIKKSKIDLLHYLTFLDVKVNHVLYKEGDRADYVYFLIEGSFEISKNIYQERQASVEKQIQSVRQSKD